MSIEIYDDAVDLAAGIAQRLEQRLESIQTEGRTPSVVLTGGTIANRSYEQLGAASVDWTNIAFFWGDERFVASEDDDRNELQARHAFLDRLEVPESNIFAIPSADDSISADESADQYASVLPAEDFDLVLLGVGPDGHVASLFPGHRQLREIQQPTAAVTDSPKPPPTRVTMTFPRLNASNSIWLLVSGEAKGDAVAQALVGADLDQIPAAGVHGIAETLWLVDHDAASRR